MSVVALNPEAIIVVFVFGSDSLTCSRVAHGIPPLVRIPVAKGWPILLFLTKNTKCKFLMA